MKKSHLKYVSVPIILSIIFLTPIVSFCASTAPISNVESSNDGIVLTISPDEIAKVSSVTYSPDGKGYLKDTGSGKLLLHVEGSPYEMGYQHGYLCGESASQMASKTFFVDVVTSFLGIDGDGILEGLISVEVFIDLLGGLIDPEIIEEIFYEVDGAITELLIALVLMMCQNNLDHVPTEFIEEMHGVADGATDAGYVTTFENVLILNMAFDAIFSIAYPIVVPLDALGLFHMCNALVAHNGGTADGNTIMGRDWMFGGTELYKHALLIEQVPDNGNAFVSSTTPGFVGVTAAMNSKGIGIGMDMSPAMDCTPGDFGMGVLLSSRYVAQYTNELSEAVSFIKNSKRGVSWIYAIGDGRGSQKGGVALEVSAHWAYARYSNYKKPWWMPQIQPQIENKKNLMVTTNHFIRTEMNILSLAKAVDDSISRYEILVDLCLNEYGDIDYEEGKDLIDFRHPEDDSGKIVGGIKSCWDLTNLRVSALYGYYTDPWIEHTLTAT